MLGMTAHQARRAAAATVLTLLLAGCGAQGEADDEGAVEAPEDVADEQPDEEEAPEPTEEEEEEEPPPVVVASPLDIPLPINVLSGSIYADRIGEIEALVREACGGDLCLTIVKEGRDTTLFEGDVCDRIDTVRDTVFDDAGQGHLVVDRGGDFVVVVNVRCEDVDQSSVTSAPRDVGERRDVDA